ncbi:MAG: hypothetical protein RLZZ299_2797 [Pseudomonadota bacterium]|jgi:uncharacterized protein (TIGR03382 family)
MMLVPFALPLLVSTARADLVPPPQDTATSTATDTAAASDDGGGCATTGAGGMSPLALVVGLAAMARRRRG